MTLDKVTVDIICRALLAIVAALRKAYDLPDYRNIIITLTDALPVEPPPLSPQGN